MKTLVAATLLLLAWRVDAGEADRDRFLKEYPEAARRLEVRFARAKGMARMEHRTNLHPDKIEVRTTAKFASDHGKRKVEIHSEWPEAKRQPADVVLCVTPDGGFTLGRLAPSKELPMSAL